MNATLKSKKKIIISLSIIGSVVVLSLSLGLGLGLGLKSDNNSGGGSNVPNTLINDGPIESFYVGFDGTPNKPAVSDGTRGNWAPAMSFANNKIKNLSDINTISFDINCINLNGPTIDTTVEQPIEMKTLNTTKLTFTEYNSSSSFKYVTTPYIYEGHISNPISIHPIVPIEKDVDNYKYVWLLAINHWTKNDGSGEADLTDPVILFFISKTNNLKDQNLQNVTDLSLYTNGQKNSPPIPDKYSLHIQFA